MARQTINYTFEQDGRDKGKCFVITEMPALQAERWAMRALLALMRSNPELPEGTELSGMAGLASAGLKALASIRWEDAEPLMDEMLSCVKLMPDINRPAVVRPLIDGDIEEISTLLELRKQIWGLHTAFFTGGTRSRE